jgi:uncharacterized protein (DUF849 family)
VLLKVCLNGPRLPADHPALPVTPEQLAADALAAVEAGADAVHLHAKDETGRDTLAAGPVAAALRAVRRAVPTTPLGLTTGAWASPDPWARRDAVEAWTELPGFASVNWHEDGADEVAGALLGSGVGVEAGLWHEAAVARWAGSPHRDRCLRVLLELPDGPDETETRERAQTMVAALRAVGVDAPVLLHGEGSSAWPALRLAGELGLDTRIGLEDVLVLPDGRAAPDNAALVRAARSLLGR